MKFEIKSRFSGAVLFSLETESLKLCVEAAVKSRANLSGADLSRADLSGANLSGAYLSGAYLYGADGNKLTLVGYRPFFSIGPIGSRNATLMAFLTDAGVYVRAGCFFDTLEAFEAAVLKTHGTTSNHAEEYHAAIGMIQWHAHHWSKR